jgi:hypothetical protein
MPDVWLVGNIKPIYKTLSRWSLSKCSCCTRGSSEALFRILKSLNKSPKGMFGCFLYLPLFKSFQYSFMSDYFVLSSYAYLHDKFYYFWQASFCIVSGLYNELVNTFIDDIDKDKVNSFVNELYNLLIDSAKTTFGTHKYKPRPNTCNKKPKGDKPWFNYECKVARQNYRKLKWKYINIIKMISIKMLLLYKRFIGSFIQDFEKLE